MRETKLLPSATIARSKPANRPVTEIHSIDLTKRSLAAMPAAERKLLLLLGHATNEINVFQKLVLMSGQGAYAPRLVDYVQAGQTLILMRTLIGKLSEAWDLFRVRFLKERQLADLYLPMLSDEAVAALEILKKHFGRLIPTPAEIDSWAFPKALNFDSMR